MKRRRRYKKSRPKPSGGNKEAWANRAANQKKVIEYLLSHPCVDCGLEDIVVLEFDHIDPRRKRGTITSLLHLQWGIVEKEMAKCAVRCANCHRRRTARQLGWARVKIQQQVEDADGNPESSPS